MRHKYCRKLAAISGSLCVFSFISKNYNYWEGGPLLQIQKNFEKYYAKNNGITKISKNFKVKIWGLGIMSSKP